MGTQETKAQIIRTAIELFNAHGTRAVSTNHIAEHMGVSPGRIYYHFRNKEEIIREIYKQIVYFFNAARKIPRDRRVTLDDLRRLSCDVYYYMWEYRFFLREMEPLIQKDPLLKRRLRDVRRRRLVQIRHFLLGLVKSGAMREPDDENALQELSTIIWLVTNSWPSYLLVEDERLSQDSVKRGIDLMLRLLKPYLTVEAVAELEKPFDYHRLLRKVS